MGPVGKLSIVPFSAEAKNLYHCALCSEDGNCGATVNIFTHKGLDLAFRVEVEGVDIEINPVCEWRYGDIDALGSGAVGSIDELDLSACPFFGNLLAEVCDEYKLGLACLTLGNLAAEPLRE